MSLIGLKAPVEDKNSVGSSTYGMTFVMVRALKLPGRSFFNSFSLRFWSNLFCLSHKSAIALICSCSHVYMLGLDVGTVSVNDPFLGVLYFQGDFIACFDWVQLL